MTSSVFHDGPISFFNIFLMENWLKKFDLEVDYPYNILRFVEFSIDGELTSSILHAAVSALCNFI